MWKILFGFLSGDFHFKKLNSSWNPISMTTCGLFSGQKCLFPLLKITSLENLASFVQIIVLKIKDISGCGQNGFTKVYLILMICYDYEESCVMLHELSLDDFLHIWWWNLGNMLENKLTPLWCLLQFTSISFHDMKWYPMLIYNIIKNKGIN